MNKQEKEILKETKAFAELNNITYNYKIETMILNAMREAVVKQTEYDMKLLQDLAALKSDTATENNSKEYKKTMSEVCELLNWYESIK